MFPNLYKFRKDVFPILVIKLFIYPGDSYSRLVFASAEGKNLWSIQAIKSMCNLDNTRVRALLRRGCFPSWFLLNESQISEMLLKCNSVRVPTGPGKPGKVLTNVPGMKNIWKISDIRSNILEIIELSWKMI